MKILLYTDVHWSTYSSIVRSRDKYYSTRLDLLIKGMNWAEDLAIKAGCDYVICAGDFFDKAQVNDEEISALTEVKWNNLSHFFLVGNHESSVNSLFYNTSKLLKQDNFFIVNEPYNLSGFGYDILLLPYVSESSREPLKHYWNVARIKAGAISTNEVKKEIIISHNDIKGVRFGAFESKEGFSVDEIKENCSLYLNGHLHNGDWVTNNILNLGSMSAHNFSNDSFNYDYGCWILDTDTMSLHFYENPYSLNFYKIEINNTKDIDKLETLKEHSVVALKCDEELLEDVKKKLKDNEKIIEYKLTIIRNNVAEVDSVEEFSMNHLERFVEFVHSNIGTFDVVLEELAEVCK